MCRENCVREWRLHAARDLRLSSKQGKNTCGARPQLYTRCQRGMRGREAAGESSGHGTLHKLWGSIVRAFLQPQPQPHQAHCAGTLPQLSFHFRLRPRRRRLSNSNELVGLVGAGRGCRHGVGSGKRAYIIWSAQEVCLLCSPLGDCLWQEEEQQRWLEMEVATGHSFAYESVQFRAACGTRNGQVEPPTLECYQRNRSCALPALTT